MKNGVVAAKPKTSGAAWKAPKGTTLPTDATTELDKAFKDLGHISEDGVSENFGRNSEDVKDWGGSVVLSVQTEKTDTIKFKLIDALEPEVQKLVHGNKNVSGTLETGMAIKVNADELEENVIVIDKLLTGNILERTVIPRGKVTNIAEVPYKPNEPVSYEVTVTALEGGFDNSTDTMRKYLSKPAE